MLILKWRCAINTCDSPQNYIFNSKIVTVIAKIKNDSRKQKINSVKQMKDKNYSYDLT